MSYRKSFRNVVAGIFMIIPAASLLFYGYPSMSLYLIAIGVFGILSSILILASKSGVYSSFISMSLLMMGFSHLFIIIVSITDQVRFISIISLIFILLSSLLYLE